MKRIFLGLYLALVAAAPLAAQTNPFLQWTESELRATAMQVETHYETLSAQRIALVELNISDGPLWFNGTEWEATTPEDMTRRLLSALLVVSAGSTENGRADPALVSLASAMFSVDERLLINTLSRAANQGLASLSDLPFQDLQALVQAEIQALLSQNRAALQETLTSVIAAENAALGLLDDMVAALNQMRANQPSGYAIPPDDGAWIYSDVIVLGPAEGSPENGYTCSMHVEFPENTNGLHYYIGDQICFTCPDPYHAGGRQSHWEPSCWIARSDLQQ